MPQPLHDPLARPAVDLDRWLQPTDVRPAAFGDRRALMPLWGAQPMPPPAWPQAWKGAAASPLKAGSLAYFHIPFCTNHCVFCGFYRNAWKEEHGRPYVDRLIAELAAEASQRPPGGSIDAVYFGGGTPTALASEDLVRLLAAVRQHLPLADDCEITLEGRISHFGPEKVAACLAAGVNRISIGVQSFDSRLRRRLGRQHGGDEAAAYLKALAADNDAVIVADLIFGLPGQDDACWANDIDTALGLGLAGIDLYAFNAYPHLPINRMIEKGALPALPDLAQQARHYAYAVRRLLAAGWTQLSNSHFASPGSAERNHYNQAIKAGADCLAYGSGAGGCRGGFSYLTSGDLETYLNTPTSEKPIGMMAALTPLHGAFSALQGGIEAGAFDLRRWRDKPELIARLQEWQTGGLLEIAGDEARLTLSGRFWGPTLTRELASLLAPDQAMPGMPHIQHPLLQRKPGVAGHPGGHPRAHLGHDHPPSTPFSTHPHGVSMSHPASHPTSHPAAHPASHPAAAPLAPQVAPQPISAEVRAALRERLAANPGIILEQLAGMNGCAVGEVIECLPEGMWWRESGERFIEIMHAVAAWQTPVTLITHSADAILEFTGPLPKGELGHGFFNLAGKTGLHGHLRHENCAAIYYLERPFMGKATASLSFCNRAGSVMFKIFAGRDESGALSAEQVAALRELMGVKEVQPA